MARRLPPPLKWPSDMASMNASPSSSESINAVGHKVIKLVRPNTRYFSSFKRHTSLALLSLKIDSSTKYTSFKCPARRTKV